MPYLTVLDGQTAGDQVALTGEILFIGRDSNNHLVIPDRIISRKHAVIDFNDGLKDFFNQLGGQPKTGFI